jgi:hypothetical protein
MGQTLGAVIAALSTDAETWTNALANVAQIAALVVGAWWAYTRFIREREPFPKATVELVTSHRQLGDEHAFLRVVAKVNNVGTALLETEELRADVYQVLPLTAASRERLAGEDLVPGDSRDASWPCIGSHSGPLAARIEPGEWDEFGFDFVVSADAATVFIYTYIKNVTEKNRDLGWTVTTLYDLAEEGGEQRELTQNPAGRTNP